MTTRVARRSLLALLELLLLLLLTSPAYAAGRLEWKSKTVKERDDKSWRIEVAIYLPKPPDVAHVPMKFEFMPEVYYERSMMDGDKLVERKVPLENRQALIETTDVGFLDGGTGNIEKRTRFSFKVTRAHGYEAGEYKVTVRDTRNGQTIGTPSTLIFEGENEIIDRRAMVFTGKEKKKDDKAKQDEEKAKQDEEKAQEDASASEGSEPAAEESAPAEPAAEEGAESSEESSDPDGEIKEKPGGCGCRIQDTRGTSGAPLLLGLALAGAYFARRRRV